ncbi:MAG: type II secretion system F family protein [Candidatus Aenigmarchaeota archaeon]|nr:type II secretion system F family protein [Candidatus Aenigmarchaeota archaeon]
MQRLPLVPLPMDKALIKARKLRPLAQGMLKSMPSIKLDLVQAEMEIDPLDYMSLTLFTSLFYFVILGGLMTFVGFVVKGAFDPIGIVIGTVFFIMSFNYLAFYPKVQAKKRLNDLEANLLYALRHLLIQVRSGVPLFESMVSITSGYGQISVEFKKIVSEINAGVPETMALDEAAKRNPSLYFRRSLWQIVNAIAREQINRIKRYGQELNPWTMLYMIIAVIAPTLGITFIIIMTSFAGIKVPKLIFPFILGGIGMFQFFFMGFIRSRRPPVVS